MRLSAPEIVGLEIMAARAWPAARATTIGGWTLHASSGFSGRINSCCPLGDPGCDVDAAIAKAEAWRAGHGLRSQFKIVDDGFKPASLPERLSALGYQCGTETIMMIGPAIGPHDPGVVLGGIPDADFAGVFSATSEESGDARERLETLARVPRPRAFARIDSAGVSAAIGACAVEGEWAGVFAMRTDARFRRQGLARRLFGSLMAFASAGGATRAWLQVEADNVAAIALYERAGFTEAYRYRYARKAP